jgi:hypothetical protein
MKTAGIDAALLEGVMANLSSVLQHAAADHGKRPAVCLDGFVLSYSQLWDAAGRVYPRRVWLVPGLLKGPIGKMLRREVNPPKEL